MITTIADTNVFTNMLSGLENVDLNEIRVPVKN